MTLKTLTHNCAIVILVNVKDVRGDNIIINLKRCNFRKYICLPYKISGHSVEKEIKSL